MSRFGLILVLVVAGVAGVWLQGQRPAETGVWHWDLPAHVPAPQVPEDNPMTREKVALGRHLFYDKRLSLNETQSCSDCHHQEFAFTDGLARSVGSTGEVHPRSSMSLANVAYASRLTWANDLLDRLEHQAQLPLFGEEPVEMGFSGQEAVLLARLGGVSEYVALFAAAFPDEDAPITLPNLLDALASFQRSLISADSPYDRYLAGDEAAMSASAKRGLELFFSERLECFHCHGGFNFTDSNGHIGQEMPEVAYHNTGLYNLGDGRYPEGNEGIFADTRRPEDMGKFRAPTLRNIAVTAPYMHDGSAATLDDVIDHYARGGRLIAEGPHAGDGAENPYKSEFVPGFVLRETERADLLAFLHSLTDETFLTDPAFSNPW